MTRRMSWVRLFGTVYSRRPAMHLVNSHQQTPTTGAPERK